MNSNTTRLEPLGSPGNSEHGEETWPSLPVSAWKDTYDTLHMWMQIVGKIRLALSPWVNHWWEVALYVSSRGLTTSLIPCGTRMFEIEFDFISHLLMIRTTEGRVRVMALAPRSVADFYFELMDLLKSLDIHVRIDVTPKEVPNPIPLNQDRQHASYEREYAYRHWRLLLQADRLLKEFRSPFIGKCSPVHFFWGSFDLAVTRFSGRRAPSRVGADLITREAYSHEVISAGFWPGSGNIGVPAFYSYAYPEPAGFNQIPILPPAAFYNPPTRGFVLTCDEIRRAKDPDRMVLDFFQNCYTAAADLGSWNRQELERRIGGGKAA